MSYVIATPEMIALAALSVEPIFATSEAADAIISGVAITYDIPHLQAQWGRDDHAGGVVTDDMPYMPLHEARAQIVQCGDRGDLTHLAK